MCFYRIYKYYLYWGRMVRYELLKWLKTFQAEHCLQGYEDQPVSRYNNHHAPPPAPPPPHHRANGPTSQPHPPAQGGQVGGYGRARVTLPPPPPPPHYQNIQNKAVRQPLLVIWFHHCNENSLPLCTLWTLFLFLCWPALHSWVKASLLLGTS